MIDKHGDHLLHELPLLPSDRGSDVVRKLVKYFEETHRLTSWLIKIAPFMRSAFYRVALSPVPIEDISRNFPCAVNVEAVLGRCNILTIAARDTGCSLSTDFLTLHRHVAVMDEMSGSVYTREALLLCLEPNKFTLIVFIITSILLSIGFGVLAGLCQESLDTGLGVFGAILGLIGIVEGFLTWLLK
ncbi:hypothetical protein BGZ61DRAFT_534286 [Ilyonectria robusta]|uniref:uncharacterized protein n=1 Tax=Ilyonectria robusta TaxID=1079257 RepID=UPI001E8E9F9F|nr:uncharacterized protein BGZ61DRAFT_534286 [Ilyonectria robusta]KAH8685099.1 hypothetical protein BGZ61DRAFT_534286 [Ilyonectria robusta]